MFKKIFILSFVLCCFKSTQANYNTAFSGNLVFTDYDYKNLEYGFTLTRYILPNIFLDFDLIGIYKFGDLGAYIAPYIGKRKTLYNNQLRKVNFSVYAAAGFNLGYYQEWYYDRKDNNLIAGLSTKFGLQYQARKHWSTGVFGRPNINLLHTSQNRKAFHFFDAVFYLRYIIN